MRSRVTIRPPQAGDREDFLAAVRASRALHKPWVSPPDTDEKFRAWIQRVNTPVSQSFLVCRKDTGALVGAVGMSNIVYGFFRGAYLGYYAFAGQEGQGLMREGVAAVVRHAFTKMKLHRLEANIQPANERSIELVRACGFRKEGFSPRYLKLGGRWRDHERWAITAD